MRSALLLALLLAACGPGGSSLGLSGGDHDPSTSSAASTGADSTSGTHTTTGADVGATSSGVTTDGVTTDDVSTHGDEPLPRWDLGPEPPLDPFAGPPTWCSTKKVDFLFVIARYEEMGLFQSSLIQSLPGIHAWMSKLFADFDYQIMVITASSGWGSAYCNKKYGECLGDFGCATINEPFYPCWAPKTPGTLTYCDYAAGAGVVFPAARGASNKPCGFPAGRRYLRSGDPDLAEAFECAARVGYGNYGLFFGEAIAGVVSDHHNGPLGCNEGFFRDDALLFITVIGSGDDGTPQYNPYVYYQLVQAAKGGDPEAVFAHGVVWDESICESSQVDDVQHFISYFEHSLETSLCVPNYAPGFAQAAKMALAICDQPPPS